MVSVSFTVSGELKTKMEKFLWINWSEVAREEAIKREESAAAWEEVEKIVSKSKLTQEQADKISDEVNWSLSKRYEALLKRKK